MKNKKGFTLVELLAVIVILGILLVVAVPAVSTIIRNSRRNADKTEAMEFLKQLEQCSISGNSSCSATASLEMLQQNGSGKLGVHFSGSFDTNTYKASVAYFVFKGGNGTVFYYNSSTAKTTGDMIARLNKNVNVSSCSTSAPTIAAPTSAATAYFKAAIDSTVSGASASATYSGTTYTRNLNGAGTSWCAITFS